MPPVTATPGQSESDAAPGPDRLQLVDGRKEFTHDLGRYMRDVWKLADHGFDYNVVAVFGSQSTGKSSSRGSVHASITTLKSCDGTLLNRLFGTRFDVMGTSNRQQTTRGIWMSPSEQAKHVTTAEELPRHTLVMDVEGTDGRERGEDQEFERRSALFSLSVAEVVIVNIWENMVGLYNGANMGLLKTVFEVHLQLFQHKDAPKTLLFFVIRDHVGVTPFENLSKVLQESLAKIWSELSKPEALATSTMHDFFDFEYAALPHKLLQADKFEAEAELLKRRFADPTCDKYVFQERYHKQIPADGFAHFAETIWEKIITNKDLDLPTQQQLLAQYRCDEISNTVYAAFAKELKSKEKDVEAGKVIEDFHVLSEVRDKAVVNFSREASRYHADVYSRKKADLVQKANAALHLLFLSQLRNLQKTTLHNFKATVQQIVAEDAENFAARLVRAQAEADAYFRKRAVEAVLPGTDWSNEEHVRSFEEELEEFAARIRVEEMEKLVARLIKSAAIPLTESILEALADGARDMWPQTLDLYRATIRKLTGTFTAKVSGFAASEEETNGYLKSIQQQTWDLFKSKLREETSDQLMQVRLRQKFEEVFRYDDNGLPQIWQQGENMDEIFVKAKAVAEELVTLFARIPLPSDLVEEETVNEDADFDSDAQAIILLTPSRQRDLRDRLKKDADSIFLDAKRGAVTSLSEVPRGMWLLLFAFGFNEIYTFVSFILSNPFLLVLLVVVATTVAVLYQSGMLGPLMRAGWVSAGPATRVVVASVGPLLETVFTGLAAFLQQLSEKMRPEGQTQSGRGDSMSAVDSDSTSSSPLHAHTPSSSVVGSSMPSTPRPKTGAAGGDGAPMSSVASRIISLTPFGTPVKRK